MIWQAGYPQHQLGAVGFTAVILTPSLSRRKNLHVAPPVNQKQVLRAETIH